MSGDKTDIARVLISERLWIGGGILIVSAICWLYTIRMAHDMSAPARAAVSSHCGHQLQSVAMPILAVWGTAELWMTFAMWGVMMAGMMLPAAIPMVLAFARMNRQSGSRGAFVPVGAFTAGYLLAWAIFCVLATVLQSWLLEAALLSPVTFASGPVLGGLLLMSAGIYQWTPWKDACMEKCKSPLSFVLTHWQPGKLGAIRLGSRFGLYCIGCCWLLMLICFALGVMNLVWMGVVTLFMMLEKSPLAGAALSRTAGLILIVWGCWMLAA